MKTKTSPYRRQLAQLARLEAAVPTSVPINDPSRTLAALLRVRSVLLVHLLLKKGLLYPWLLQHASGPICEKVCLHRDAMTGILEAFLRFCSDWSTEAAIATNPQEFVQAWGTLRAVLFAQLSAERNDLYDLADGYAERQLALAS
ncbi:MAG TPA: hypothetical protein VK760_00300 [Candidatus Acidoferrales bacterium]|jgi:hypothetical protein|nr:hypothetical protein [Candidatus Acidoferrales bacterium]